MLDLVVKHRTGLCVCEFVSKLFQTNGEIAQTASQIDGM